MQPPPTPSPSNTNLLLRRLYPYGRFDLFQLFRCLEGSFLLSRPFLMQCRSETFREGWTFDNESRCLMQTFRLESDLYGLFLLSRDLSKICSQDQRSQIIIPELVAARLVTVHSEELPRSLALATARFIPEQTLNELVYPSKGTVFAFQHQTFAYRLIHFPFDISVDVMFPYSCLFQSPCRPWLKSRSCLDFRMASSPRVPRRPALIYTRVVP